MQVIVAGALGVRSAGLYASRCMVRWYYANVNTNTIFKQFLSFFCLQHIAFVNFTNKNYIRCKSKTRLAILRCNCQQYRIGTASLKLKPLIGCKKDNRHKTLRQLGDFICIAFFCCCHT